MSDTKDLIQNLNDEADQARNDGADDIAGLLGEAVQSIRALLAERDALAAERDALVKAASVAGEPVAWRYRPFSVFGGELKQSERWVLIEKPGQIDAHSSSLGAVVEPLYTTPPAAVAPTCTCPSGDGSLRWPCQAHPAAAAVAPVLVRDVAEVLGASVAEVSAALVAVGRPPRSTNMEISGEELLTVAAALAAVAPVALTDEQIDALAGGGPWWSEDGVDPITFARAIEAAHGIVAQKGGDL